MISKKTKTEFYFNQLKRIAKKMNVKISKDALIALANHLETHTKFILRRASFFANKERRKIIKAKDIEHAKQEGILLEKI
ncbi:MAG: NFYB/HAP3 family transcription factor subunit [Candidatus Pacearchaeota archaeon]